MFTSVISALGAFAQPDTELVLNEAGRLCLAR